MKITRLLLKVCFYSSFLLLLSCFIDGKVIDPYLNITSTDNISVIENSTAGTTVHTVIGRGKKGIIRGVNGTLTHSLNPSTYFKINGQGIISVNENAVLDYESTKQHKVVLTVNDGTLETTQLLTFTIININDEVPSITSSDSISVKENSGLEDRISSYKVKADGNDGSADSRFLTYTLNPAMPFRIIQGEGRIAISVEKIDYEATSQHTAVLTVFDGEFETTQLLTFKIIDINDNRPTITSADTTSVIENSPTGTIVHSVTADGKDIVADSTLTYSLDSTTHFAIDDQGEITINGKIDFESTDFDSTPQHKVVLAVFDGKFETTQQLTFTITNVNDNTPTITSADSISVAENSPIGTTVHSVVADGNDDAADSTLTYSLTPLTYFAISSTQGEITINGKTDYESTKQHTVVLTVFDGEFETTQLLTFTITNVNDNTPTITSTDSISVEENSTIGTTVHSVTADGNDGAADSTFTYSLDSTTHFAIDDQGKITINGEIDYEVTSQHTVVLTVKDGVLETTQLLTFTIINVDQEAPTIISTDSISVAENSSMGTTVHSVITAGGTGNPLTYFLSTSTHFEISSSTQGTIFVKATVPDYETSSQHTTAVLTVIDGAFQTTQLLTFTITNVDEEPPTITSTDSISVTESSPTGTTVHSVTADGNDDDAESLLTYVLNPARPFRINRQGEITIDGQINYEATSKHTAVLTVSDGKFETTQQLTFTILNVNDEAPTITSTDCISVIENSTIGTTLHSVVADGNDGPKDKSLTYSLTSTTHFAIDDQGKITVNGEIDYEASSQHTVVLTVFDGEFETTQLLTFKIINVNDNPPIITSVDTIISATETSTSPVSDASSTGTIVHSVTADGKDVVADSTLTYSLDSTTYFAIDDQGKITINGELDYESTEQHKVVLTVSDGAFETTRLLTFMIININDNAPTILSTNTISVMENSTIGTLVQSVIADGNDGAADGPFTYLLRIESTSPHFVISSTRGEITINGEIDYESTKQHIAQLTVIDGRFEATQELIFNIINVNDVTPGISLSTDDVTILSQSQTGTIVTMATITLDDASTAMLSLNSNDFAISDSGVITTLAPSGYIYITSSIHHLVITLQDDSFITTIGLTVRLQPPTLANPLYRIKQGVIFIEQLALPVGFPNTYTPVFLPPLPADTTPSVTNSDIQEFSILYDGDESTFTVVYSFKDESQGISLESVSTGLITFTVDKYDPLRKHQWHLKNTGQSAFATIAGNANEDIRVAAVHRQNILGEGIIVAVVDSGLVIDHEDLRDNVVPGGSYNFLDNSDDPTPSGTGGDHGTSVAGLIAMRGWNNVGGTGVAPMASLIGYNYITSQTLNPLIASLGYGSPALNLDTGSEQAHIFNMSFGILPTGDEIYNSNSHDYNFSDLLRCGTTGNQLRFQPTTGSITAGIGFIINCNTLNSGKGALYIKSSGNGFNDPACPTTNANISCDLVNGFEVSEGTPYVMVVGAFNADGERSSYSSSGPALWISAPGGESGYSNEAFTPLNDRSTSSTNYRWGNDILTKSAMVTTDVPGCNKGYSENSTSVTHIDGQTYTFPVTPFHGILRFSITSTGTSIEPHPENRNCNYVSTFNGNSSTDSVASGSAGVSGSAAPVVSGVAALILSANSDLYWRDVRYILAKTARKVDADSTTSYSISLSDGTQVLRKGWSTNTAGFSFHHWYGFGAVDAEAAVNMAKTYTDYLNNNMFIQGEWIDGVIDSSASTITDNSINGVTGTVTVLPQGMEWIEGVQIRLSATHTNVSDLTAKLISPSGTESIILRAFNSLGSDDDFTDTLMYSNEFYRETTINGTWQLVITDNSPGETGKATGWKIRFFGQKSP